MRIFLSFMNAVRHETDVTAVPCYYESFIRGLSKFGNDLLVFHGYGIPYGDRSSTTAHVRKILRDFSPDVVFAFNNWGPDYASMCDCPIYIIEVDSPLYYDSKDAIRAHPERYNYFIVQEESRNILRGRFGVPDRLSAHLPFFFRSSR